MSYVMPETARHLRAVRARLLERPPDLTKWTDDELNAALSLAFVVHHDALTEGSAIDETNAAGALAVIQLVLEEGARRGIAQDPGDALWRWFHDVADAYVQQTAAG